MTDLDTDYLAKDPSDVRVRWMNLSDASRVLLSNMADIVRGMDEQHDLAPMEPIDVARGLISIYDRLPPWVGRTQTPFRQRQNAFGSCLSRPATRTD